MGEETGEGKDYVMSSGITILFLEKGLWTSFTEGINRRNNKDQNHGKSRSTMK